MLEVIKFDSFKEGKNLLVLGTVHGNEICGSKAILKIIKKIKTDKIKIKSGSITFIPFCNPKAFKENKRFIDINLNRTFKKMNNPIKYEEIISQKLIKYIDDCDYLLDIHSIPSVGPSFAFLDVLKKDVIDFVKIQNFKHIMTGWNELFNEEDNSSCGYGFSKNKICTTIECGNHNDPKCIKKAENAILNSMAFLGITDMSVKIAINNQKYIKMENVFYREKDGELTKYYNHLDKIKKGEVIAKYNDGEVVKADRNCLIIMPHNQCEKIGVEWFYLGRFVNIN